MSDLSVIAAHLKKYNDAATARKIVNALLDEAERLGQDYFHRIREELNGYLPTRKNSLLSQSFASGTLDETVDRSRCAYGRQCPEHSAVGASFGLGPCGSR